MGVGECASERACVLAREGEQRRGRYDSYPQALQKQCPAEQKFFPCLIHPEKKIRAHSY